MLRQLAEWQEPARLMQVQMIQFGREHWHNADWHLISSQICRVSSNRRHGIAVRKCL